MDKPLRRLWFLMAVVLLLYAFYQFVVQSVAPATYVSLGTFTQSVSRAFIAILIAAGIFTMLKVMYRD